jgi:hypothetical protein
MHVTKLIDQGVYFFYNPLPEHGAVGNRKDGKKKFKVLATRVQSLLHMYILF